MFRLIRNITLFLFGLSALSPVILAQHGQIMLHSPHRSRLGIHTNTPTPLVGTALYLFEVGTGGWDTNPTSLLSLTATGVSTDANGNGYITTDSMGNFDFTGLYTCPGSGTDHVYLLATGGSAGGTGSNSGIAEISALPGSCSDLSTQSIVTLDETTTIAAAFALAPFANVSATPIDGFSTDSSIGSALDDAFTYANNIVNGYTGVIGSYVSEETINTLADILDVCVSNTDCADLYSYTANPTYNDSGFTPADTWQAAVSMVGNPGTNIDSLYGLIATTPPYTPILSLTDAENNGWVITPSGYPQVTSIVLHLTLLGDYYTIGGSYFSGSDPSDDSVALCGIQPTITADSGSSLTTADTRGGSNYAEVYGGGYGSIPFPCQSITGGHYPSLR